MTVFSTVSEVKPLYGRSQYRITIAAPHHARHRAHEFCMFCVKGFVVGFRGSSIYCLHCYVLSTIAVPPSAPMYQHLEKKMLR